MYKHKIMKFTFQSKTTFELAYEAVTLQQCENRAGTMIFNN